MQRLPRIAVIGSGISGLGLAGMLSARQRVFVEVFERADKERDEGYGLDLSYAEGQAVLRRAGVYHRFWEMTRPKSDVMVWVNTRLEVVVASYMPPLVKLFRRHNPEPESNRARLRTVLLEALQERGVAVHHGVNVTNVVESDGAEEGAAMVKGVENSDLGAYDLVVDATGVHSPLRSLRVHDPVGKHPIALMIHGLIESPEASTSSAAVEALGEGSLCVIAHGYQSFLQRFGADPADKRTSFFYLVHDRTDEKAFLQEMGLEQGRSRRDGMFTDTRLKTVQEWLHRDMVTGRFHPIMHEFVDALSRVTVRANMTHGPTTLREHASLPLICVGDSLRNIGLGGGGNLALHDALELDDALAQEGVFDGATHACNMARLLPVEQSMLERKNKFYTQREQGQRMLLQRKSDPDEDPNVDVRALCARAGYTKLSYVLPPLLAAFRALYRFDKRRGAVGSGYDSVNVEEYRPESGR